MAKYRKIPVVIDALRVSSDPKSWNELDTWVQSFGQKFDEHFILNDGEPLLKVKTLEGTSYDVPDGYYIIRGIKGEYYPCDPDVFAKTYEAV